MTVLVPVLAIDGPSGSGKGTVAGMLAHRLGWNLLDSGAIYRLLALAATRSNIPFDDECRLANLAAHLAVRFQPATSEDPIARIFLDQCDVTDVIRTEAVGADASRVAALPSVRAALLQRQRDFQVLPGLVADGRDMGTVVFPQATLKVFLTASAEERAQRRYLQLKEKGLDVTLERLIADIRARDLRDTERSVAPLMPAPDAVLIDSTCLEISQVHDQIFAELQRRLLVTDVC